MASFIRTFVLSLFVLAPSIPATAQLRVQEVAAGFTRPVVIAADPSDARVLIVGEQGGLVKAVVDGVVQAAPFLDLSAAVRVSAEEGLLGLTFSPDGSRVFVSFTRTAEPNAGATVISRFRRSADPLVLDPSTRRDVSTIPQPTLVHKGGNLAFGPDGYLYIGLGDGGAGNGAGNAQEPASLLGKMLRIDVNVPDADPTGYRVPASNPFVDGQPVAALHEIWAFGYRNPWRFSFDDVGPGATGAMLVGDVGQDAREEIDYEPAGRGGRNYGWYLKEGFIDAPGGIAPAYQPLTYPLVDYTRNIGRSVTGGFVYRGMALPSRYRGRYFVADFFGGVYSLGLSVGADGEARVIDYLDHSAELGNPRFISTFGRGTDGELYFTSFTGGRILKIVADPAAMPARPESLTADVQGSRVALSWQPGAGGAPLQGYQLEAGSRAGASNLLVSETTTNGVVVDGVPNGTYFVRVRSINAAANSLPSAEVTVLVGCTAPPLPPAGLAAVVEAGGRVSLTWNAAADASGYLVLAGTSPGASDVAQMPVAATALGGVVSSGTYHVRVQTLTACGPSVASNEITVVVP
jgi:glucose/arabinose dehydrogenase